MKKLFFLGALFAVGLGFTACSSDKDEATETNILDKFDAYGKAHVNVSLMLPFTSETTRTTNTANDQFPTTYDANEYTIANATLILFTGTLSDEANATFQGAYTLENITGSDAIANNIERVFTATIDNDHVKATSGLLALVIANHNGQLTVNTTDNSLTVSLSGGSVAKPTKGVTTFTQFQGYQLANIGTTNTTNGLLMSNAPLASVNNTKTSTAPSGSGLVKTLVVVDESKISPTESAASTNPAITVFLERAAAKLTVTQSITNEYLSANTSATFTASSITWLQDVLEPSYYAVRNPGTADTYAPYTNEYLGSGVYSYRFFGANPELSGGDKYRYYWAVDPHYNYSADTDAETNLTVETDASKVINTLGSSVYLTENTMNELGLTKNKTTRILLAVTFNSGNGFFSINNGDVIYTHGDQETDGTLAKKILEYLCSLPDVASSIAGGNGSASDITVTVPASIASAGSVTSGITITVNGASTLTTDAKSAISSANVYSGLGGISYYLGGKAYYQARIQHFGDTETPLNPTVTGSSYSNLYGVPASPSNFLGRYSVVRNNWYNLNVTSIKHLGSATIPTPDTTPDDEIDQYLGVKMYVVKWAKRTQDVAL